MVREVIPGTFSAGMLVMLLAWLGVIGMQLSAQTRSEHQEAPMGIELWPLSIGVVPDAQPRKQPLPGGIISAEFLRYPLSSKARGMLRKALQMSEAGNHPAAIQQLQETLAKFPASAAYVHSLLGVEYLKNDQIPDAVKSLEEAVKLLPHDAENRANFGVSLVAAGQLERAELELRRALELDRKSIAKPILEALLLNKHSKN